MQTRRAPARATAAAAAGSRLRARSVRRACEQPAGQAAVCWWGGRRAGTQALRHACCCLLPLPLPCSTSLKRSRSQGGASGEVGASKRKASEPPPGLGQPGPGAHTVASALPGLVLGLPAVSAMCFHQPLLPPCDGRPAARLGARRRAAQRVWRRHAGPAGRDGGGRGACGRAAGGARDLLVGRIVWLCLQWSRAKQVSRQALAACSDRYASAQVTAQVVNLYGAAGLHAGGPQ